MVFLGQGNTTNNTYRQLENCYMALLREETRNRWSALTPDKFISTVLYGALGDQLKLAYTFIAVYTQIMHNLIMRLQICNTQIYRL